jgi:hypothetical protein
MGDSGRHVVLRAARCLQRRRILSDPSLPGCRISTDHSQFFHTGPLQREPDRLVIPSHVRMISTPKPLQETCIIRRIRSGPEKRPGCSKCHTTLDLPSAAEATELTGDVSACGVIITSNLSRLPWASVNTIFEPQTAQHTRPPLLTKTRPMLQLGKSLSMRFLHVLSCVPTPK